VSNIHAQQWYNGELPRNLTGFINDKSNRLIGWAIMRQLRIKSDLCHIQNEIISTCQYDYSSLNEDKDCYQPGWLNETNESYSSSIEQSFEYEFDVDGYVYEFRGRLSDLQSNLSELHKLGWIDSKTRSIIIELNLYNPNVELFTSITFLTEFLSTGGIYPTAHFEPMNFYGN
jgi:polycystin 1L2